MADISTYEGLLADWRKKEAQAHTIREFHRTGGEHRLMVKVFHADPAVEPFLNELMEGDGWHKLSEAAVRRADREARAAKARFEGKTLDEAFNRQPGGAT